MLGEEQKSNENLKKKQDNLKEIIRDLQASIDVTRADNLGIKDADKEEVRHLKKEIDKLKRMLSKAEVGTKYIIHLELFQIFIFSIIVLIFHIKFCFIDYFLLVYSR